MTVRARAFRVASRGFAVLGVALAVLIAVGFVLDAQSFDRTRGGYEPPYESFTGEPIDWDSLDVTPTGMARRGHVVNLLVDCTSGMISFELYRVAIPFRPLSPRALAVHKPREACQERGFEPAF